MDVPVATFFFDLIVFSPIDLEIIILVLGTMRKVASDVDARCSLIRLFARRI